MIYIFYSETFNFSNKNKINLNLIIKNIGRMVRATKANRDNLIRLIGYLSPTGATNYGQAFYGAYKMYNDTVEDDIG